MVHGFGRGSRLMASRSTVADHSSWPPERKTIPGTAAGTCWDKQRNVAVARSSTEDVW